MKYFLLLIVVILVGCIKPEKAITSEIKAPYSDQPIVLSEKFTESNFYLHRLELSDLRLLRNEIFARKGYVFKSKELCKYFSKFDWYEPKYVALEIDKHLTPIDSFNIKVIQKAEKKFKDELAEKERHDSFTFADFLDSIPEIKLPGKCWEWEYENNIKFDPYDSKNDEFFKKFEYWPTFGKISINDSLSAIGIIHASDLHAYTTFFIVNRQGQSIDQVDLPLTHTSSEDSYSIEDTTFRDVIIGYHSDVVITKDLKIITSSWEVTSKYKSPDVLLESIVVLPSDRRLQRIFQFCLWVSRQTYQLFDRTLFLCLQEHTLGFAHDL